MKRFIWGDYVDAYIERNDEKTIIDKVCEEAAEDGVLSEKELEQIHEEMVDELYQKQYEEEKADEERRNQAYLIIAEKLHNEMEELRVNYLKARSAYIEWTKICVERGLY